MFYFCCICIQLHKKVSIRIVVDCCFKVEFQICESRKNNTKTAANVRVTSVKTASKLQSKEQGSAIVVKESTAKDKEATAKEHVNKEKGFIAVLKENCGFIEMADHEKEVFFQFWLV